MARRSATVSRPAPPSRRAKSGYLGEIDRYPRLTAEDEAHLAGRIAAGNAARSDLDTGIRVDASRRRELQHLTRDGDAALEEMVCANLRLVVTIAYDYLRPGVDLLDLVQEGNIGLMRAAGSFDPTKGARFGTWAAYWIHQAVERHGMTFAVGPVRVPAGVLGDLSIVNRTRSTLMQLLHRSPEISEIADESGLTEARVRTALAASDIARVDSTDQPVSGDGETRVVGDLLADPGEAVADMAELADLLESVTKLLRVLDEQEATVVGYRLGLVTGSVEPTPVVAERVGVPANKVRVIESRAFAKMLHPRYRPGL
jgi:RNA polymerase sigma factor (sigma-70 family)